MLVMFIVDDSSISIISIILTFLMLVMLIVDDPSKHSASLWIKVGCVAGAVPVITKTISVRSRKYIVIQQNTQKCGKVFLSTKVSFFTERIVHSDSYDFPDPTIQSEKF